MDEKLAWVRKKLLANKRGLHQAIAQRLESDETFLLPFVDDQDTSHEEALRKAHKCLAWQSDFVQPLLQKGIPPRLLENPILSFAGHDKHGAPVGILSFLAASKKRSADISILKQEMVFALESQLKKMRDAHSRERITLVADLQGCDSQSLDLDFFHVVVECLENYYPSLLNNLLILERPWFKSGLWDILNHKYGGTQLLSKSVKVGVDDLDMFIDDHNRIRRHGGILPNPAGASSSPAKAIKQKRSRRLPGLPKKDDVASVASDDIATEEAEASASNAVSRIRRWSNSIDVDAFSRRHDFHKMHTSSKDERDRLVSFSSTGGLFHTEPDAYLLFQGPLEEQVSDMLTVHNDSDSYLAFKLRANMPEMYHVKPRFGLIKPQGSSTIAIMRNAIQDKASPEADADQHKFLVLGCSISASVAKQMRAKSYVKEFWANMDDAQLADTVLDVRFDTWGFVKPSKSAKEDVESIADSDIATIPDSLRPSVSITDATPPSTEIKKPSPFNPSSASTNRVKARGSSPQKTTSQSASAISDGSDSPPLTRENLIKHNRKSKDTLAVPRPSSPKTGQRQSLESTMSVASVDSKMTESASRITKPRFSKKRVSDIEEEPDDLSEADELETLIEEEDCEADGYTHDTTALILPPGIGKIVSNISVSHFMMVAAVVMMSTFFLVATAFPSDVISMPRFYELKALEREGRLLVMNDADQFQQLPSPPDADNIIAPGVTVGLGDTVGRQAHAEATFDADYEEYEYELVEQTSNEDQQATPQFIVTFDQDLRLNADIDVAGPWRLASPHTSVVKPTNAFTFEGTLRLQLDDKSGSTRFPFAGAEVRTARFFDHGKFFATIQPASPNAPGVVTSFRLLAGPRDSPEGMRVAKFSEIGLHLGGPNSAHAICSVWTNGALMHREAVHLNAAMRAQGVMQVAIEWLGDRLVWSVSGSEIHRMTIKSAIPSPEASKLRMSTSVWAADDTLSDVFGAFDGNTLPTQAVVHSLAFIPAQRA